MTEPIYFRRFWVYSLVLALACITVAPTAWPAPAAAAIGPRPDFGVTIGPAVLCRDKLDMKFYYDYLTASFGPSYKREQGAYWFKSKSAQLFGKEVKEVFVSDQSTDWIFVGALFNKVKPDEVAKAVQTLAGPVYVKIDAGYQYSPYLSQGTSEIMWQNTDAKLLCRKYVNP